MTTIDLMAEHRIDVAFWRQMHDNKVDFFYNVAAFAPNCKTVLVRVQDDTQAGRKAAIEEAVRQISEQRTKL